MHFSLTVCMIFFTWTHQHNVIIFCGEQRSARIKPGANQASRVKICPESDSESNMQRCERASCVSVMRRDAVKQHRCRSVTHDALQCVCLSGRRTPRCYLPRINIKGQKIVSPKAGWQKREERKETPAPEAEWTEQKAKDQVGDKTWCSISNSDTHRWLSIFD